MVAISFLGNPKIVFLGQYLCTAVGDHLATAGKFDRRKIWQIYCNVLVKMENLLLAKQISTGWKHLVDFSSAKCCSYAKLAILSAHQTFLVYSSHDSKVSWFNNFIVLFNLKIIKLLQN